MSSFLDALQGKNRQTPPVWFMRQAGRYLPSYQAFKKNHTLLEMFKTPKLAEQVTLLPFEVLDLDAAIIFSDILVVFEALGFKVDYPQGPHIEAPSKLEAILQTLKVLPVESTLSYVFEAIERVKPQLKVPLLGFSATPFTLFAYLLQKPMQDDIKQVKDVLYKQPEASKLLLEILTEVVIDYAKGQIKAGIDAWQFFDTASTWLSDAAFITFSAVYTERVLKEIKAQGVPTILFSKSSLSRFEHYQRMSLNAVSVDWTASYPKLRARLPSRIGIQGNLDPYLTTFEFPYIQDEVAKLVEQTKGSADFIFNLGHGVFPETKLETLQAIIKAFKGDPRSMERQGMMMSEALI